jgi:fructose-1,6-bisphosphatase-3
MDEYNIKYLNMLSEQFPTIQKACCEIIRLTAQLKLPKLTEHFMSDIHGEYESFLHILKNASGVIKDKITSIYGRTLSEHDRSVLATLIYYPEQKLELVKRTTENIEDWYKITLYHLIEICRIISAKYTRSHIRSALPENFGDIIDELIHSYTDYGSDKAEYYNQIISTIVELGQADEFIIAISKLIQQLAIGRLHIIGDIFDRGPRADIILDRLISYHSLDIQWGNHDISWMGAAAGSDVCIANVISISTKYTNFDCLEDGYGINLRPLTVFALETYANDPCECFIPRNPNKVMISQHDRDFWAKLHKAIAIIQFKLEGQTILRHPEYNMQNHLMLNRIDYKNYTINIDGVEYKLKDSNFPTINPENPFELTEEEARVMDELRASFRKSEKLQRHIKLLFSKGSMYLCYNSNLLYHGCIPMNEDGSFKEISLCGQTVSGKAFLDLAEQIARNGYFAPIGSEERANGLDFMWFLWCGSYSPLYGKNKMTSFERYFIDDESTWTEIKDVYYSLVENAGICKKILREFGIIDNGFSHIINGHVPVKIKKGESPVKAGGRLLVIDGGLSRAYQSQTGIAGYTLLFNSHGLLLSSHDAFDSVESAIAEEKDIHSTLEPVAHSPHRLTIEEIDQGRQLQDKIETLYSLVDAYKQGIIKEK